MYHTVVQLKAVPFPRLRFEIQKLHIDPTLFLQLQIPLYWNDSRLALDLSVMDEVGEGRWYYLDPDWKYEIW